MMFLLVAVKGKRLNGILWFCLWNSEIVAAVVVVVVVVVVVTAVVIAVDAIDISDNSCSHV